MKMIAVLALASVVTGVIAFSLLKDPKEEAVVFPINSDGSIGTYAFKMPVSGQVCSVPDLNYRNETLPQPLEDFGDNEGRNSVVVLNSNKEAVMTYASASRNENGDLVLAKVFCLEKPAGSEAQITVRKPKGTVSWWLNLE